MSKFSVFFWLCLLMLVGCRAEDTSTTAPVSPTLNPNSAAGRGAILFSGKGRCATCHALAEGTIIVGPSLAGIATRAGNRVENLSTSDYLTESIIRPDAYRPPGFEERQMDSSLAKVLTIDEVNDLVAFLMTLE